MNTNFPTVQQIKERARELRREYAPRPTQVTLLYWLLGTNIVTLITLGATQFLPSNPDTVSAPELFLSLLLWLYGTVLLYGYDRWMLWTCRGERLENGALLDGFSEVGRVVLARIWVVLHLLPWGFLVSLVAVALLYVLMFSMVVYTVEVMVVLMVMLVVGVYLAIYLIGLRYELTNFLLTEFNQLSPAQAVRRSAELMEGQIWRLFRLKLSFIGWHLVQMAVTLAISLAVAFAPLKDYLQSLEEMVDVWTIMMYAQRLQEVLNGGLVTLLTLVAALPIVLYVTPYQRLAEAEFYTQLVRPEPEASPWQEGF